MSAGPSLPSRAFFGELAHLAGDLQHALLVGVPDHRHDQAVRRVGGEADVEVLLSTRLSPSSEALNSGNFFSAATHGLDQEREHRHLDARLLVLLVERDAERLELGDVGFVVLVTCGIITQLRCEVGAARSS